MAQEERALTVCEQMIPFESVNFDCVGLPSGQWSRRSSLVGKEFLSKDDEVAPGISTSESKNLFTDGDSDEVWYDNADSPTTQPPCSEGPNP